MEAVREITEWRDVAKQPNHDYLLDGDRVVAYRPWGTAEIRVLKGTLKIDRRGRRFEPLKDNPFRELNKNPEPMVLTVKGSKGNSYTVNVEDKSCTCPGYTFRGRCKHVEQL
jgi:hypothetical protein